MFEMFGGRVKNNRVRNEEVHRRIGIEMELASRVDLWVDKPPHVLRWFGHVEIMDK